MTIKSKKINNHDPNRKCDKCRKNIEVGKFFYLEKNITPHIPRVDNLGFCICEDCHNK